jgi:hypothetical protein
MLSTERIQELFQEILEKMEIGQSLTVPGLQGWKTKVKCEVKKFSFSGHGLI